MDLVVVMEMVDPVDTETAAVMAPACAVWVVVAVMAPACAVWVVVAVMAPVEMVTDQKLATQTVVATATQTVAATATQTVVATQTGAVVVEVWCTCRPERALSR